MTKLTLAQVAKMVGGEASGDPDAAFEGAASLAEAGPADIAYFADAKLEPVLAKSRAGLVLMDPSKKGTHKGQAVYVADPKRAFSKVLAHLEKYVVPKRPEGHHPTAVISAFAKIGKGVYVGPHVTVEEGASIGEDTKVWAGAYIGHGCQIGRSCVIYPNVVIRERTTVGDRVIVHPGTVIGSDGYGYNPGPEGHEKVPQIGRVVIEDDVEIGANATIDRATTGVTRIGKGTKVDNLVQIAHNVNIGRNCLIVSQVGISGSCEIGDWAVLAGQVGVADHLKVGTKAQVGAQSGLMYDVPEGTTVFGSPARPIKEAMRLQLLLNKLPDLFDWFKKSQRAAKPAGSEAQAGS